jgi:hypothetical protein
LDFRPAGRVPTVAAGLDDVGVREYGDPYDCLRLGIYDAKTLVSNLPDCFATRATTPLAKSMIDAQRQGRSYGRASMRESVVHLRLNYPNAEPSNSAALAITTMPKRSI